MVCPCQGTQTESHVRLLGKGMEIKRKHTLRYNHGFKAWVNRLQHAAHSVHHFSPSTETKRMDCVLTLHRSMDPLAR